MRIAALIVAGGRGMRAAVAGAPPKQYARIGGAAVLQRTVAAFFAHPGISLVQVVIGPDDRAHYADAMGELAARLPAPVMGGATRQASVLAGLEALAGERPDAVLIHDGVRPFVEAAVIDRVIDGLGGSDGAVAGLAQVETLKVTDGARRISSTLDRGNVWRAQTPQGFRFAAILEAHRAAARQGLSEFTDDAAVAEWAGLAVIMVEGVARNVKLTTAEDIALARLIAEGRDTMEYRTGSGFDVHRLVAGDHVWLGGIRLAHDRGLEGHSDADVALHALTDALLGAVGAGDIGQHFPPSDPKWRGAASRIFLAAAMDEVRRAGGEIVNADVTIIAEAPKVGPHREAMRAAIATILGTDIARVSIKATTTEGLGLTGRREGIAAMATATVRLAAGPS